MYTAPNASLIGGGGCKYNRSAVHLSTFTAVCRRSSPTRCRLVYTSTAPTINMGSSWDAERGAKAAVWFFFYVLCWLLMQVSFHEGIQLQPSRTRHVPVRKCVPVNNFLVPLDIPKQLIGDRKDGALYCCMRMYVRVHALLLYYRSPVSLSFLETVAGRMSLWMS